MEELLKIMLENNYDYILFSKVEKSIFLVYPSVIYTLKGMCFGYLYNYETKEGMYAIIDDYMLSTFYKKVKEEDLNDIMEVL